MHLQTLYFFLIENKSISLGKERLGMYHLEIKLL